MTPAALAPAYLAPALLAAAEAAAASLPAGGDALWTVESAPGDPVGRLGAGAQAVTLGFGGVGRLILCVTAALGRTVQAGPPPAEDLLGGLTPALRAAAGALVAAFGAGSAAPVEVPVDAAFQTRAGEQLLTVVLLDGGTPAAVLALACPVPGAHRSRPGVARPRHLGRPRRRRQAGCVLTFEPFLEHTMLESRRTGDNGSFLSLDPELAERLLMEISATVTSAEGTGRQPVLVCAQPLRPAVRRLVRNINPGLPVLSYAEIGGQLTLESIGVVNVAATATV